MCNTSLHHRPFNGVVDPFSFSTFHLLRTCNRLMLPTPDIESYYNIVREHNNNNTISPPNFSGIHSNLTATKIYNESEINCLKSPILDVIESIPLSDEDLQITDSNSPRNLHENLDSKQPFFTIGSTEAEQQHTIRTTVNHGNILMSTDASAAIYQKQASIKGSLDTMPPTTLNSSNNNNKSKNHSINKSSLPTFDYIAPASQTLHAMNDSLPIMELNRVGIGVALGVGEDSSRNNLLFPSFLHRRPRGEKRPIPDEQKDDKYYERRKRNNEAAKKSRDARKIREDRIAFRAALLEQENSILRAQVMALRDEMQRLRQLMSVAAPLGPQRISSIAT